MPTGVHVHKPSYETRRKLSLALKGNKNALGRKHTEETKRKIGLSNKNKTRSLE